MNDERNQYKVAIVITIISVVGTLIGTLGSEIIVNWNQIFSQNNSTIKTNTESHNKVIEESTKSDLMNKNNSEKETNKEKSISATPIKKSTQFENLENLLQQKQWVRADLETDLLKPQYLTCSQLSEINQLWIKYSSGNFGYSVQRKIWEQKKDYIQFVEFIGWKKGDHYAYNIYDSILITGTNAEKEAPLGHIPFSGWQIEGIYRQGWGEFMDKLKKCNI